MMVNFYLMEQYVFHLSPFRIHDPHLLNHPPFFVNPPFDASPPFCRTVNLPSVLKLDVKCIDTFVQAIFHWFLQRYSTMAGENFRFWPYRFASYCLFGKAFTKSAFKNSWPPFIQPSPLFLPYPFLWAFSSTPFLGFFAKAHSPINKGGYGL